jgi:hypothetical protein
VERGGAQLRRFGPVSQNCRGWLLRSVGALDAAREANECAAGLPLDEPQYAEPRYAGHLDLVDHDLVTDDLARAARRLDGIAEIETWSGSMHWRHRTRYRLQRGRVALASGSASSAQEIGLAVAEECRGRGVRRYELIAGLLAARAVAALSGPDAVDRAAVVDALSNLEQLAAPEVWWLTAEVAASLGGGGLWQDAARRLDTLAAGVGHYGATLRAHASSRFPALGA